jgi:hypothetical protein
MQRPVSFRPHIAAGQGVWDVHFTRKKLVVRMICSFLGLLTLLEYVFGVALGIDQLLLNPYITVAPSHPGCMAPNTAVGLLLAGTALGGAAQLSATAVGSRACRAWG